MGDGRIYIDHDRSVLVPINGRTIHCPAMVEARTKGDVIIGYMEPQVAEATADVLRGARVYVKEIQVLTDAALGMTRRANL